MSKAKSKSPGGGSGFEANIKSLETIIEKLEGNDTDLQDALSEFENGINLARTAQKALADAEQKVSLLLNNGDEPAIKKFLLDEDEE
jgi:exodeoxyribonuclease VII small subunit